ncbi:LON peptidase substrate-binding domain-containing protein [Aquimarina sp. W85]|uniref:LON peptidase substrate-binding domain-containing protein n=1 Tax=Aquimarina rhodophyticola TaxID=3342246 RepID=UPI00366F805F
MRLALFPLPSVVYPGERVPLHIFEPRYKELIKEINNSKSTFGIPVYINKVKAYGTEVALERIENTYKEGEIDILCTGKRIFKIDKFYKQLPGKLYAGGDVLFQENDVITSQSLQAEVLHTIHKLYIELSIDNAPSFNLPITSYQVAHKIGLSIQQEYQLLTLFNEIERLQFILNHLRITLPVIKEINRTKTVIQMNGHFKNFDPLDFEDFEM